MSNGVINAYRRSSSPPYAPTALLTDIDNWWALQSDLANSAAPSRPLLAFATSPTYGAAGARPESALRCGLVAAALTTDYCFGGWITPTTADTTDRLSIGPAGTVSGASQRGVLQVMPGGSEVAGGIDDASDSDYPYVVGSTSIGTAFFCRFEFDHEEKTVELFVNESSSGTTLPVTSLWTDAFYMTLRSATSGSDVAGATDYVNRLFTIPRKLTPQEGSWLYHGGLGRDYSEILDLGP